MRGGRKLNGTEPFTFYEIYPFFQRKPLFFNATCLSGNSHSKPQLELVPATILGKNRNFAVVDGIDLLLFNITFTTINSFHLYVFKFKLVKINLQPYVICLAEAGLTDNKINMLRSICYKDGKRSWLHRLISTEETYLVKKERESLKQHLCYSTLIFLIINLIFPLRADSWDF